MSEDLYSDDDETPRIEIDNVVIKELHFSFEVTADFACREIGGGNELSGHVKFLLDNLPAKNSLLDVKALIRREIAARIAQAAQEN
ncbi:hypothetical protein D3W54_01200 [Komagataeibacter medellinensis]|uniref:Uncharacterized protein n=1 Tax=Komagataeibacter medellinensis TaxID=1177712 RepID=A0ABQ6VS94_9PROT|nr:hypothetical protein D3W54_01200 [Komagataeibacter medellinensis]